jgi:hypothetical protein
LKAPDRGVFEAVRFLDCNPEIGGPPPREITVSIEPLRSHFCIIKGGVVIKEVFGARAVVEYLHMHLFACSMEDRPQTALLHAACLKRGHRRLLLVGAAGAGKTTLALRLARAGYELEGDEHVFIGGAGVVVARPRACRIKESALPILADMAPMVCAAPFYRDNGNRKIFNFDPRALGSNWCIEEGPADRVVVLQPNHGGYSSIRPLRPTALVQSIMPQIGLRETGHGSSVAALAALANRTKGFDLSLGDHEGAVRCIELAMDP